MGWLGRQQAAPEIDFEEISSIYFRRFAPSDRGHFARHWCEIARIYGKHPTALHEDDPITDRPPSELFLDDRMEELVAYVKRNVSQAPPQRLHTIGDVVDLLLSQT